MSKFKVGDEVVRIFQVSGGIYSPLTIGSTWVVSEVRSTGHGYQMLMLKDFKHEVQSDRFVSKELYNSPLYQALK